MSTKRYELIPIGKILFSEKGPRIQIDGKYQAALKGLDGFSHVEVIWWFSRSDDEVSRNTLEVFPPYKTSVQSMGVFATRSPARPNPLGLSTARILSVKADDLHIVIDHIDAENETPVLDLKPYTPSLDRVERPIVPNWCRHWPASIEKAADFDWENEFIDS